ncbi:PREDICTED: U6 snRNA phosphodiesterase-like [Priapulus caudatus]|uniref:U6 snRNA phosphodiesterase 1 n=1 Tax=Priapulus caudatus TaxID=37621 RepID=A0ABM1E856_PRICU|nr:PREDICTED: U6 snRNA phosphodiesterase-like [Priapulus caudatus]
MHGGRVRSFAHVRGNWATYIFVPVTVDKHLGNLVRKLVKAAREFTGSDWQCVDDFHISVSRTVVLAHHCIEPFTDSIKTQLEFVKSFIITFEGVELYTNDEKTRSFLGLKVGFGHSDLCNIIAHTDAVMQDFHLTKFYLQPSFHMSVGWCVGDLTESVAAETITCFNKLMLGQQRDHGDSFTMLVSEFRCKTGNRVYVYPLDDS